MKKFKLIIVIVCVAMLAIAAFTASALEGFSDLEVEPETTSDHAMLLEDTEEASEPVTELELTDEQLEQLKELRRKCIAGTYIFQEMVVRGKADPAFQRMTLQEVKNIVSQSACIEDVISSLEQRQPYPDYAGGSGINREEYWLDDDGNEMIMVFARCMIIYRNQTDCSSNSILLDARNT